MSLDQLFFFHAIKKISQVILVGAKGVCQALLTKNTPPLQLDSAKPYTEQE